MNVMDRAFSLLPKSVQITMLLEDLKRVEGTLEYHRGLARYLEGRSSEIRSRLSELGARTK